MWARRLGVPPLWPSRVKVFFLGLLTSVFIVSVFQYLHNANVEYLDIKMPVSIEIRCRLPSITCRNPNYTDPVACMVHFEDRIWHGLNLSDPCPNLPPAVIGQTCKNPTLPLSFVAGDHGSLRTVNSGVNPFKFWSILFLVLALLLSVSIVIHDLALLDESLRPRILSIPNLKYASPCFWECLNCTKCRRRLRGLWARNRLLCFVLLPFLVLFQAFAFMAVMYPFSLLVYLVAPVKMSRIMVFLSGILCMLWSIVFVTVTALFDTQVYAVIWGVTDISSSVGCVCLCEYPLSQSVITRIVVLGSGVCWHSFNLTFRALKGLRRGQWANMFSVLYAVPIEAFPVVWKRSAEFGGGGPIQWRNEDEDVQSEPAFDPFALMDEQPESAWTRALIVPVAKTEQRQLIWEPYMGTLDTEIGCCGFPRPAEMSDDPQKLELAALSEHRVSNGDSHWEPQFENGSPRAGVKPNTDKQTEVDTTSRLSMFAHANGIKEEEETVSGSSGPSAGLAAENVSVSIPGPQQIESRSPHPKSSNSSANNFRGTQAQVLGAPACAD